MATATNTQSVKALGTAFAVTMYNNLHRLPTRGLAEVVREKAETTDRSDQLIFNDGWLPAYQLAELLRYMGAKLMLVKTNIRQDEITTEHIKFEAFINPDNPEDDCWLKDEQAERVFDSLAKQNIGVSAVFENPQGLMLVVRPMASQVHDKQSKLKFTLNDDGQLVLLYPEA